MPSQVSSLLGGGSQSVAQVLICKRNDWMQSWLCPKPGRAPLAASSNAKQPMEGRRPRAILPSGRVSLTLIGRKLLWERKFGKFHTSRSRAVPDINKTHTKCQQTDSASAPNCWSLPRWHHSGWRSFGDTCLSHRCATNNQEKRILYLRIVGTF